MDIRVALLAFLLFPLAAAEMSLPAPPANGISLAVDARDLGRGLLHARLAIPTNGGTLDLVYPRWIPGTHSPGNPVQNLVDLRFHGNGAILRWDRDEADPWLFHVAVPPGVAIVEVDLSYIADQPSDPNSIAADVHAGSALGVINLNTVVLYPTGRPVASIPVDLALALPEGWKPGSALARLGDSDAGVLRFARCSLRDLVDRPIIAGPGMTTLRLANRRGPPAYLHGGSDDGAALDPAWSEALARVVDEGMAVVGRAHYREYHFLLVGGCGHLGLEHAECSLSGIDPDAFADLDVAGYHDRSVMPHEFFHSWCGKHVRPEGMMVADFQTTQRTGLLWVYEGLTTYYGYVLTARAGLADPAQFREGLSDMASDLARQSGRRWRSVEDTARAGWLLRGYSSHRHDLRRGQEYYPEGALFWMEADVRIRRATAGRSSLDDVCRLLFAPPVEPGAARAFGESEIIDALQQVLPYDWRDLMKRRITDVAPQLDLDFLALAGWRLAYSPTPDTSWTTNATLGGFMDLRDSLGCLLVRGQVYHVVSDGAFDRAGIGEGQHVVNMNGQRLSGSSVISALTAAKESGSLTVTVEDGGETRDITVAYAAGPRFAQLQRVEGAPDLIADILAAQAPTPITAPRPPAPEPAIAP